MAKETDGRGRATMNEDDIEYLRNINTRPGPNAGHSIDPTKPGPDDALERETPSDHSLGLAAQAWCEPETSHKIMDEALCTAFARILDRALAAPAPPRADASASGPADYIPIGGAGNGA